MDVKKYYEELYKLQDKILEIVFKNSSEFYLTGGTCLNRFYVKARYSDDLDFFTNSSNIFNLEVKRLKTKSWIYKLNVIDEKILDEFNLENIIKEVL